MQVIQFLMTLGLIAVVVLLCVQVGIRLRLLDRENTELRHEMYELHDQADRSQIRMRDTLVLHRELIRKAAEHLQGGEQLVVEDLNGLAAYPAERSGMDKGVGIEIPSAAVGLQEIPVNTGQKAPIAQSPRNEPPLAQRATVSYLRDSAKVADPARKSVAGESADQDNDADPDPLTRAINLSRQPRK